VEFSTDEEAKKACETKLSHNGVELEIQMKYIIVILRTLVEIILIREEYFGKKKEKKSGKRKNEGEGDSNEKNKKQKKSEEFVKGTIVKLSELSEDLTFVELKVSFYIYIQLKF
jgi:hypothetical protein